MCATQIEAEEVFKVPAISLWTSAQAAVAKMYTGIAAHDISISSHNVSNVSGFLQYTTSFRDPHK
jgi:hypothetical protein